MYLAISRERTCPGGARKKEERGKKRRANWSLQGSNFPAAPEPLKCSRLLDRLDRNVSSSSNRAPKFRDVRNMRGNDRSLSNFHVYRSSWLFFYVFRIHKILWRICINEIFGEEQNFAGVATFERKIFLALIFMRANRICIVRFCREIRLY